MQGKRFFLFAGAVEPLFSDEGKTFKDGNGMAAFETDESCPLIVPEGSQVRPFFAQHNLTQQANSLVTAGTLRPFARTDDADLFVIVEKAFIRGAHAGFEFVHVLAILSTASERFKANISHRTTCHWVSRSEATYHCERRG
ncbi:MAG: hypothetical protein SOY64_01530 [Pyramidobacter sp.]|uniref:hypothetical protein n=1 Tax=Pyramidobacter sp. TaxID=1943581 RepID=UPI002A7FBC98|nr:hypothetical protein [Pyramidobacter sp.]MDY4031735.1 hypothetical protein [Pyramidobacter sp.]